MITVLITVLTFVGLLFVLVLAHEWGHFFTARRFGVRVDEFGFGFPPRLAKLWHRRGTDFTLNTIPLGGFVRLKGEDGSDAADSDSFAHQKAWKRLIILFAGVAMNFLLGFFIFFGVYAYGVDTVVSKNDSAVVTNARAIIGGVVKGSPAERAALQPGDEIISVNGVNIFNADQVRAGIRAAEGREVTLKIKRAGAEQEVRATPALLSVGVVALGIEVYDYGHVQFAVLPAARLAASDTYETSLLIFKTIGGIIKTFLSHGRLEEGVSGPVGIAVVTGQVARAGFVPFLQLVALMSINLGVLNALPFPALDGGRALFVVLEKILRKKVRMEIERSAHIIGFALLMALVVAVTYRDIVGLLR